MSSRSRPLPSPELDGDFDPSIHLTPTRNTFQRSGRSFMKSSVQIYAATPKDEIDMRDSASPESGPASHSYTRDQSSPSFLAARSNPLGNLVYPMLSTSPAVRLEEIAASMQDDDEELLFSTPPPMPPAMAMYNANSLGSRHHPFQFLEDSAMLSPSTAPVGAAPAERLVANIDGNSPSNVGSIHPFTSARNRSSSTASGSPGNKRRNRHVRSNFVLDGNFAFGSDTTKPAFERATTTPQSVLEQQQQRHPDTHRVGNSSTNEANTSFSQLHDSYQQRRQNRAFSAPSFATTAHRRVLDQR